MNYCFSQHYKIRFNFYIEDLENDDELEYLTNVFYKRFLDFAYIPSELFSMNVEDEIYTKHYFVVSCTNFKYNHKYYGSVMSDDKMIIYYSGRELTIQETKNGNRVHRPKVPIEEIILKTIFAGLNSYKILESPNVVHFLKFTPAFLYFYKYILDATKFFFDLPEGSLRFVHLRFRESIHIYKKIRSIKKNLKKKNNIKARKDDYCLITL